MCGSLVGDELGRARVVVGSDPAGTGWGEGPLDLGGKTLSSILSRLRELELAVLAAIILRYKEMMEKSALGT